MDAHLWRHALRLPPRVLAGKVWRRLKTAARRRVLRWRDARFPSCEPRFLRGPLGTYLKAPASPRPYPELTRALAVLCPLYLDHRFDLLGSGWTRVSYGAACRGLEGRAYAAQAVPADPCELVNPANREESRRIRRLLAASDPEYQPIDWSLDFKSGYRWPERLWRMDAAIGPAPGADIKVPWELSRMRHLPRLALAYAFSAEGAPGFEPPERYRLEYRSQVLDFMAANPPRFGVNWRCPMEAAIRAANMLAARDLFLGAGAVFDPELEALLARSAFEHGRFIAGNLEWAEEDRGNHYLADLTGLVFIAARLPRSPLADAWLAFGAREFVREVELQFLPDGGSFEASTGYHRLSAQMAAYGAAQILALGPDKRRAMAEYDHRLMPGPPGLPPAPLPLHPLPRHLFSEGESPLSSVFFERLARVAEFAAHLTRPDGAAIQTGDNDSGSFFSFQPVLVPSGEAMPEEDMLDNRPLLAALDGFFHRNDFAAFTGPGFFERDLTAGMTGSGPVPGAAPRPPALSRRRGRAGELENPAAAIAALPEARKRILRVPLPPGAAGGLELAAYPDFGIYVMFAPRLYLALRCFDPAAGGIFGHSHDDNLGLELWVDGQSLVTDPGSYVYTPLPEARNAYRSAAAHFAPRAVGAPALDFAGDLFTSRPLASGECLYFREDGFYGILRGRDWAVARAVILGEKDLRILDGALEGNRPLDKTKTNLAVTRGYGKKTEDPACLL